MRVDNGVSGIVNRDLANWLMAKRVEIERVMQARLGAAAPAASGPEAETLRRFRTFVSTALVRGAAPRPVLEGLRPNERRVMALLACRAEVASEMAGPDRALVIETLRPLIEHFRFAIRTTGQTRKTSGPPRASREAWRRMVRAGAIGVGLSLCMAIRSGRPIPQLRVESLEPEL